MQELEWMIKGEPWWLWHSPICHSSHQCRSWDGQTREPGRSLHSPTCHSCHQCRSWNGQTREPGRSLHAHTVLPATAATNAGVGVDGEENLNWHPGTVFLPTPAQETVLLNLWDALLRTGKSNYQLHLNFLLNIRPSVRYPWHFGTDPYADLDPWIRTCPALFVSDLQEINKK